MCCTHTPLARDDPCLEATFSQNMLFTAEASNRGEFSVEGLTLKEKAEQKREMKRLN